MKTVGVILAGGLSKRFGSPKAFAKIEDKFFYEYAISALAPNCDDIVIVTRPELVSCFPKAFEVMTDDKAYRGLGPLAGIYTVMKMKRAARYLILPCDMPFLNAEVIERLLAYNQKEVVAVKTESHHYPLISIWHPSIEGRLQQALEEKRLSVIRFLNEVQTTWVDGNLLTNRIHQVFKNINREKDLERGEEDECNG